MYYVRTYLLTFSQCDKKRQLHVWNTSRVAHFSHNTKNTKAAGYMSSNGPPRCGWLLCKRSQQHSLHICLHGVIPCKQLEIVGEWVMNRRPFWIKICIYPPYYWVGFVTKKAESCSLCCVACGRYMHGKICNVFFHCRECSVECFYSLTN